MKKIVTLIITVLCAATLFAQSPEKFTYQAVVRNASNVLVVNAPVGVRVSILQGGINGNLAYMETQTAVTNANGLITLQIGGGSVQQGVFADIDWANGPYFLKTETDPNGGSDYSVTSVQQLLSVPYALYSKEAGNGFSGDYNDLTNLPQIPQIPADVSAFNNDAGYLTNYTETDPEFNAWDKDYNDLINTPTIPTVPENVSTFTNDAGYITSADIPEISNVPTNVSAFTNDAGYITTDQIPAQVNADWNATSGAAQILNKPNLFSGNYNDLTNKPTLFSGSYNDLTDKPILFSGNYNDLTNKPTLFSGNYNDLTNKPALFSGSYYDLSDRPVLFDGDYNSLSNRPNLATVATSGSYNDLSEKPTIPTVPTNVSAFTNDAGYITSENIPEISNVPTNVSAFINDAGYVSNAGCTGVNLCDLATNYAQLNATLAAMNNTIDSLRDRIGELENNPNQTQADTTIRAQACLGLATVTDYDLNVYNTVQIGNQCWMRENLRSTHYADGTAIASGTTSSATTAYYYPLQGDFTYGYLYNWKAVMRSSSSSQSNPSGVQGICPNGWHVPSDAEWDELETYVSGQSNYLCSGDNTYYAKALAAKTGWVSNTGTCVVGNVQVSNNATGFSALPAGHNYGGSYTNYGTVATFWSSTEGGTNAFDRSLDYSNAVVTRSNHPKGYGFSVRCLRDGGNMSLLPTVSTMGVTTITSTTAVTGGNITDDGGAAVTARGVCWGTSHNPTTLGNHTNYGEGMGGFTSSLTGLTAGTTYFVRAYATNSNGTKYGDEVSFSTPLPFTCGTNTVTDYDNNVYNTVQIGEQCWMKENMRATHYSNGTAIIDSISQISSAPRAYYDAGHATNYGYLYNWSAAKGVGVDAVSANNQGICPTGWHVPSDGEWTELTQYVGSQSNFLCNNNSEYVAKALASTTGWISWVNECAVGDTPSSNNATGFSALPAGLCANSSFNDSGSAAFFWSTTAALSGFYWYRALYTDFGYVSRNNGNRNRGHSVRCLRD